MNSKLFYLSMILISSLGYLSSVLISRFQIHFNGCPFFRVHITGKAYTAVAKERENSNKTGGISYEHQEHLYADHSADCRIFADIVSFRRCVRGKQSIKLFKQ